MATNPVTYRISPEVDAQLKRLAKVHGGTDKALRFLFGWTSEDARPLEVTEKHSPPSPPAVAVYDGQTGMRSNWKRGPRPKGDKNR